ncbi:uncharacterized protein B0H64DRAFT_445383 [Chaetomium fimeti]|uniref:Uncharacterized protein n=1 Tax=Chaetomium fimeti TaxID=1854472 RepID=A0AAE0LNY5_9PEZI|nr:hypothetical protein B0H64DRAFT_445383 [Chaetomium fimeti]
MHSGSTRRGDCPTINWPAITSKITGHGLDTLPAAVRDFYLVGQVVANASVCSTHKANLLSGYLDVLNDLDYWTISGFCSPRLAQMSADALDPQKPPSSSVEQCLLWMEALTAKWPLPASVFTEASIRLLRQDDIWMGVFFWCSGCMKVSGRSKDELWTRLGYQGSYLSDTEQMFKVDTV